MNILVTGANGQLGNCIKNSDKFTDDNYFYTDIDQLDICSYQKLKDYIESNKIDLIINCAAYTNVDRAEETDQYEIVKAINTDAVKNLAMLSKEYGIWLFHISTDYVFGGNVNNIPCTEEQAPNPTGVYGMTKLMAENEIKSSGCKYLIFRTAWLYSEFGRNFVKTMLKLMKEKSELKVVFDQCGTPTYAQDLADAIVHVVNCRLMDDRGGVYNYSNQGVCSWFDFAKMIQELAAIENCEITPCHSKEFPSAVLRPSYSVLDKTKFERTFSYKIPYWVDSLKVCVDNLLKIIE